jgi:NitT/TauT family transport system ATP-binding protein
MTQERTSTAQPIDVHGVRMVYSSGREPIEALSEIDLEVAAGEFVSVVGPSGCGKSTLLKIIAGLAQPTEGVVRVNSQTVDRPVTDIGIVFQEPVLLEWRRALANVMLQVEMRGLRGEGYRSRAEELLGLVGLRGFEDRYPHELSGGMQQRVAICRALVHDPPLLLMDEPFGALDALTREQIADDLQRIWLENRKTVIFVTHSVSEAVLLSDRIVVLSSRPGRITGTVSVKLPRPRSLAVRESADFAHTATEVYELLAAGGVRVERAVPGGEPGR